MHIDNLNNFMSNEVIINILQSKYDDFILSVKLIL